jgi:hypothetical protein
MAAWLLALLLAAVPPGLVPARETEEAARERYASIAEDLAAVTTSRTEASLLIAVAVHESGLRLDVDQGLTRGGGRDVCLLQLRSPPAAALTDRQACLRAGLRLVRASLAACRAAPERDRLAQYASGSCSAGLRESRAIMDSWRRLTGGRAAS